MLRIRKPKNFNWKSIFLVCTLGSLGGYYIYQPLLQSKVKEYQQIKEAIPVNGKKEQF